MTELGIKFSNSDHDYYGSDHYNGSCKFLNMTDTYTRQGTTITIKFLTYTVVFILDSVVEATTMTCTETDIPANNGFAVGQVLG